MGKYLKLGDGSIIEEDWNEWEFVCKDGERVRAKFTDKEIEKMKKENPEVIWKETT